MREFKTGDVVRSNATGARYIRLENGRWLNVVGQTELAGDGSPGIVDSTYLFNLLDLAKARATWAPKEGDKVMHEGEVRTVIDESPRVKVTKFLGSWFFPRIADLRPVPPAEPKPTWRPQPWQECLCVDNAPTGGTVRVRPIGFDVNKQEWVCRGPESQMWGIKEKFLRPLEDERPVEPVDTLADTMAHLGEDARLDDPATLSHLIEAVRGLYETVQRLEAR